MGAVCSVYSEDSLPGAAWALLDLGLWATGEVALPTAILLMPSGQLSKAKGVDSRSHLGEMVWYKETAGLRPQSLH